jgi:hypothetical protein
MQATDIAIEKPESADMGKKRGRPPKSERDDTAVKMDRHVVKMAKFVADTRDIPLAQYLTELVRGNVKRDFNKAVEQFGHTDGNKP